MAIKGRVLNFTRYTATSAFATTVSQLVLLAFSLLGDVPAAAAGATAFVAGAVPQFLIVRRWAWGPLNQQLATFVTVTLASGLASVGMVTVLDQFVGPAIADRELQALVLNAGYLLGGAPIFLAKFLVLDRVFFSRGPASRRVGARKLDQGAGGEAGGAGNHVVVGLLSPRRAGDVQMSPR